MGCKFNSSHRKALEKLAKHPEYIGLKRRSVLSYSIEPVLFYRGNFHAEPDLVFFLKKKINTKTNDLIPIKVLVIEYKSNGDKRLIDKGEGQLEKTVDYYQKIMKLPAEGRLITGDSYPMLRK